MTKMRLIKINRNFILTIALVFFLSLSWVGAISAETEQTEPYLALESFSNSIADIAEKVGPAVVNIDTVRMVKQGSPFFSQDPIFRNFFGEQFKDYSRTIPQKGTGSGFIISQEGYILTNEHVVHKAEKIKVTLSDGRKFTGKLIGSDLDSDIAIVKIDSDDLPIVTLGDSDKLRVGEIVIAIGNPYGLQQTVTMGVVSAEGRSIPVEGHTYRNFIQTDAAINPGNSGGPLLNTKGEVVGINTAIIAYAQGIGFAIPINIPKKNIDELIKLGKVRRSWLGVYIQEVTPEIAEQFGLSEDAKGVLVGDVVKDSPAEKSGIERGDIITKVNDKEVDSPGELQDKIRSIEIGKKANIEVVRDGKKIFFVVIIDEMPTVDEEGSELSKEKVFSVQTGLKIDAVTPEIAKEVGLPWVKGLVITEVIPGSSADDMGLQRGDIILEANRVEASTVDEWEKVISKLEPGDTLLLLVFRSGHTYYVPIKVEKID
jgi:serine protease Do